MVSSISCLPANRCKQWKKCDYCAAIRQAQIATIAETGASFSRHITYAVIRTNAPKDIDTAKNKLLRALKPVIDGGIWTIETGAKTVGLHLNLILGSDNPIEANRLAKHWINTADIFAQEVHHQDVRNIAAYISKKSGSPRDTEYSGRLYGSFGTWKKPLAIAADQGISPIVAGMALSVLLDEQGIPEPKIEKPYFQCAPIAIGESKQERKDRLERNKLEKEQVNANNKEAIAKYEHMTYIRQLLTAYIGKIELDGYVFVAGYGIASRDDLVACGLVEEKNGQ